MTIKKVTKRFIAGAVCPRCAEMDKLVMYLDDENNQARECVRCGYQDVMTDNGPEQRGTRQALSPNPEVEELATRVNKPRPGEQSLAHEDEVQVINILSPQTSLSKTDQESK